MSIGRFCYKRKSLSKNKTIDFDFDLKSEVELKGISCAVLFTILNEKEIGNTVVEVDISNSDAMLTNINGEVKNTKDKKSFNCTNTDKDRNIKLLFKKKKGKVCISIKKDETILNITVTFTVATCDMERKEVNRTLCEYREKCNKIVKSTLGMLIFIWRKFWVYSLLKILRFNN